jgi:segregation and condensation protein A
VLASLNGSAFMDFVRLFRPEEGRRGVTVTFVAILELLKEGLIDIVQSEAYGPLHVRLGNPSKRLMLVTDDAMDAAANDAVANDAAVSEDPTRDP